MVKIQIKEPDKKKYYLVRTENTIAKINKWINFAKKEFPKQKLIIVNNYKRRMLDKKNKDYWIMRFKKGYENKYYVYGSY